MIYRYNMIPEKIAKYIGGKAYNLYKLSCLDFNIPEWYVIPSLYFRAYYKENRLEHIKAILEKEKDNKKSSEILKSAIIDDEELRNRIVRDILPAIKNELFPVSVRSSALNEDSETLSFAGQYSTFLNIKTKGELPNYILKCIASQFEERNIVYKKMAGQKVTFQDMAVIIQKMVKSQKSGVIFTVDPVIGDTNKIIINANFGQGEGIVSDRVKSDMYSYDRRTKKMKTNIVLKDNMIDLANEGGTVERKVSKKLIELPVLNKKESEDLIDSAEKIEKFFGVPQDIEFAIEKDKTFILQARPVTTKIKKKKHELVWDNSNIVESFSGPTTPLTFSFANEAYTIIYKLMCLHLGVSPKTIEENKMIYTNMIGFINNRIYYSLNSWFTALSFLPAYKYNKEFMEKMMGVKEQFSEMLIKKERKSNALLGKISFLKLAVSIFTKYVTHGRNIEKFKKTYERAMKEFETDINKCRNSKDAIDVYIKLKNILLEKWITPVINDTFAMVFYGLLSKFLKKISADDSEKLQNNLLTGEGNMESVDVTVMLYDIAESIKRNKKAIDLINHLSPEEFIRRIEEEQFNEIREKFYQYIDKFGSRCVNELKLETPNLRDKPEQIVPLIKNYVNENDFNTELIFQRERDIRTKAENKVKNTLQKYYFLKRFFMKIIFKYLLRNTRYFIKNRENMRLIRTNVFGIVKVIFKKIGDEFSARGVIEDKKDIFFLTVNEIVSYIYGTSVTKNLKKLINLRKEEYEKNTRRELPERFYTEFIPYADIPGVSSEKAGKISGIGCSPGHIKGTVEIVKTPYIEEVKGDILVAERTDPGWLPVFPLYKGIILERGSVLSHSAIVARELGIPVIVGVRGVTSNLKNGDLIDMDGGTGSINILTRRKSGN